MVFLQSNAWQDISQDKSVEQKYRIIANTSHSNSDNSIIISYKNLKVTTYTYTMILCCMHVGT